MLIFYYRFHHYFLKLLYNINKILLLYVIDKIILLKCNNFYLIDNEIHLHFNTIFNEF